MTNFELPVLRPLSVGPLFDRAFRLYRKNFAVFIGVVALTQIPLAILNVLVSGYATSQMIASRNTAVPVLSFLVIMATALLTQIGTAALTQAIADDYLNKPVTLSGTFQRIKRDWVRLIGTFILLGLVMFGLLIPVVLVAIIPCLGPVIAVVASVGLGLVIGTINYLLPCVVILEKDGGRSALKRAWQLVSLRFWWVVGYVFLLGLLNWAIVLGPTALIAFFVTQIDSLEPLVASMSEQVIQLLVTAIFTPLQLTAITLMYFDLRIRYEGFDLMVLASAGDKLDGSGVDDLM